MESNSNTSSDISLYLPPGRTRNSTVLTVSLFACIAVLALASVTTQFPLLLMSAVIVPPLVSALVLIFRKKLELFSSQQTKGAALFNISFVSTFYLYMGFFSDLTVIDEHIIWTIMGPLLSP